MQFSSSFRPLLAVVALAAAAASAHAELITSPAEMGNGLLVQTFDEVFDTSTPRVQIGASVGADVGVSAANGPLIFGAPFGAWSLGDNGEWTSAQSFVGVDGGLDDAGHIGTLVFDFGGKTVSQVGALLNFDPGYTYGFGLPLPLYIAAYGVDGTLLDSYELPVSTPGAVGEGAFFGIRLASAQIARFEVSGPYAVVDDLSFTAPVPEPSSWALMAAGLAAVAVMRRRRA
ncbi:MAG: PEP-CTERM sorting domain-containing protein [Burkholderiales bacterium]|nr:PEP-CTERM sorting domain-containing protein [Burkholderiales bacterium]